MRVLYLVTLSCAIGVAAAETNGKGGSAAGGQVRCTDWTTERFYGVRDDFFSHAQPGDVSRCLAAGARVNAVDEWGNTPLHRAARVSGNVAVVEALLAAGGDVHAQTQLGQTVLDVAAPHNKSAAVIEVLIAAADPDDDVKSTLLLKAAPFNNRAVVEVLIASGADVTARDSGSLTPLHGAAQYQRDAAVFEVLIAAGGDAMARTEGGLTPLHLNRNLEAVDVLIAAGARIGARDAEGRTPLHVAAAQHSSDDREPPLSELISALVAYGASVDARDEAGDTPLHRAAANEYGDGGSTAIIALLNAGADARIRNGAGQTAWDLAQANDRLKGSDGYWRLNEAQYEQADWNEPEQEEEAATTVTRDGVRTDGSQTSGAGGRPSCLSVRDGREYMTHKGDTRVLIENSCAEAMYVRYCVRVPLEPSGYMLVGPGHSPGEFVPGLCNDAYVLPDDGYLGIASNGISDEIYWRACVPDDSKAPSAQECYFDLPR